MMKNKLKDYTSKYENNILKENKVRETVMRKDKNISTRIRQTLSAFLLGMMAIGTASAAPISGKVYLDYDNTGSSPNAPLSGITVEVLTSSGAPLATPLTTTTAADGSYSFNSTQILTSNTYKVKASTANSETIDLSVTIPSASGVSGQNLFLKGNGGDISILVQSTKPTTVVLKDIPVSVSAPSLSGFSYPSSTTGYVYLRNTLQGETYTISTDADDFISNTSNSGKNYALWSTSLNGTEVLADNVNLTMSGTAQNVTFNARERNEWGANGLVAVDQDGNGSYGFGIDTGVAGFQVALYYRGTTTPVVGQTTKTTNDKGEYQFENLPLGDYTAKVLNMASPWEFISGITAEQNFSVSLTSGNPLAFNYLIQVSSSDTTLPGISGYVFAFDATQKPVRGPDSGAAGNSSPTTSGVRFATPVTLLKHDGTSWNAVSTLTSNTNGSYSFKGLVSGGDYKVQISESGINTSLYTFIGDTDGKSTYRSVTLSSSATEQIKGKEIVFVNLTSTKTSQNFWYSEIKATNVTGISTFKTINGISTWGGNSNGVVAVSMAGYFTAKVYEEDGLTPALKSNGTPVPQYVYRTLASPYATNTYVSIQTDHAALYVIKDIVPDVTAVAVTTSTYFYARPGGSSEDVFSLSFAPANVNNVSGRVYFDKNGDNTYVSSDDIAIYSAQIRLDRLSASGYVTVSRMGTDTNGIYNFTNLPDGDYRIVVEAITTNSNINSADFVLSGNSMGTTNNWVTTTVTGGVNSSTNDVWYSNTNTEHIIKGNVYLDSLYNDNILQTALSNGTNDFSFWGVELLLCQTTNEADCVPGNPSVVFTTPKTLRNGAYEIKSSDVSGGILDGVDYILKPYRADSTALTNSSQKAFYPIVFSAGDAPFKAEFLMKGNAQGDYHIVAWNDINGDRSLGSSGGTERERNWGQFALYYHDGASYQLWANFGLLFWSNYPIQNLPEGKYKIEYIGSTSLVMPIADPDTSSAVGVIEFSVDASGTISDGLGTQPRYFMVATEGVVKGATEGLSGSIYLDVAGSGVKDGSSVLLPASELVGTTLEGFYTPRLYPNYTYGEAAVLASPDFIDTNVASTNRFVFNAANSQHSNTGKLYITNYLAQLKNLPAKYEIIANSGQAKGNYLSSTIKNDLSFMQVTPTLTGAPDQYYLVKMVTPSTISGKLFYDINGNATYESGIDEEISGVRVELYAAGTSTLISYVITDSHGDYKFNNLFDGLYDVKVTPVGLNTAKYELLSPEKAANITISSGNPNESDVDFIYNKIGDASISGYVMLDMNNNGVIDIDYNKMGDLALSGLTVELYKTAATGTPVATTVTNAKGYYQFPKLDLDTDYFVKVIPGTGYGVISNTNTVGSKTSDVLDKISIGSTAVSVTSQSFLLAGNSNSNPSGGISNPAAQNSGISGFAYQDGTTTPISASVMISLYDSSNVEVARQYTDAGGKYQFYNLPNGTYTVMVSSSVSGFALSSNSAGTTPFDTISSIALSGSGSSNNNFFYKESSIVGITGEVRVDFANDNTSMTFDGNDHPLSGAKVELYEGLNAAGTAINSATASTTGAYAFPNLLYGIDYSVKIDMSSITDYAFKQSTAGSAATDIIINVPALVKAGSENNNYLVIGKLNIDGKVWIDADGDLVQGTSELLDGVTVNLNYKAPGASNYSLLKSMTTGTSPATTGQYLFSSLPKGTDYQVVVDGTSTVLAGTSLIADSGAGSIANNTDTFTYDGLVTDSTGSSTAYQYNGSVSGQFIIDVDGNNAYVSGADDVFAGVDVTLSATINSVLVTKTATTDTDGKFSFDNLPIGNWSLTTAATQTVANWSDYTLGFVKSSAGTTVTGTSGLPLSVAITATDTTFTGIEAGYKGSAKISGYIVIDMDPSDGGNAVTGTDTPVASATVTLGSATAGFVSRTTTTDASGYYEFTGLSAHTYKVTVDTSSSTDFAGHVVSFDPLGTTVSTVDLAVATPATVLSTQDFGYKSNGSLAGYIYRDLGGEGTRHAAVDDKMAGVRVKATQGSLIRYSNVTVADGEYKIENLPSGLWTVELDTATLPANISYSYITDLFGETATVVVNGAEVEINPTAAARAAVRGATVSFGVRAAASISGQVVIDVDDQDPLPPAAATVTASDIAIDTTGFYPGYSVNLYVGSTLVSTQAVSSGAYSFTGLSDGVAYIVEVLSPASDYINSFATESTDSGVTAGAVVNTAAKMSRTYTLAATATSATDSHFGWKGAGGISGNVFWDADDNGSYSSSVDSDVGSALTVTLTHGSGSVPAVSRTIASGSTDYSATGLLPGSWTVTVTGVPSTFKASFDPDNAFSATSLVPNADKDKATITVGGSTLTNQHFGYVQGGVLSGVVLHDANATGSFDPSSDGVEVVELSLLDMTHSPVLDSSGNAITITTSSSGEFSLRNLDPSVDYKLQTRFGSAANSGCRLAEMEPSYDSEVGAVSLSSPVSSTVDVTAETHTVVAAISSAPNNEIASTDLHFGYRAAGGDLTIHKTVLKDNVVVGDIVPYTITIENNKATTAFNVTIKDLIPAGFKYVDGSARLDGVKIADPTGARPVYFGPMDIGGSGAVSGVPSKRTLSYMLVVGAGVTQGEYTNVATALDRTGNTASNTSQATVTVTSDPLFNDALIFGKVYVDRNGNGVQDAGEEGIGGVKLVTARGEIITTDSQGRYHLTGVDGGRWERGTNFVLKLDPRSLPEGYRVKGRNPQVVRLSPGLPSKIDFKVEEK
ncbi:SdrD B-like domain-containing protein [Zophobihabitans entericus]|uniref:DUF11 domain-containing protein n=1 Tax=Zophobihabitans entericus TaxID=1635327 RepID=A0A6G9IAH9_9GAMM|nr:SdrD B-like domain-containing protein [Zophobihabitans entericus]QIQ21238.1 DUF11 domain-containing protein [Zophobihabitans entericus]